MKLNIEKSNIFDIDLYKVNKVKKDLNNLSHIY